MNLLGWLGIDARAQQEEALPQATGGGREKTDAPSVRGLRPCQARVTLLISRAADCFRFEVGFRLIAEL